MKTKWAAGWPCTWGVGLAALGLAVNLADPARAQTASGSAGYDARCGGHDTGIPVNFGDDVTFTAHGECGDGAGGFASINDVSNHWTVLAGLSLADGSAVSDFFGTHAGAGTASTSVYYTVYANDVRFTSIADPNEPGTIFVGGMHYLVGGIEETLGTSNCSASRPRAIIYFSMSMGGLNASGTRAFEPDLGLTVDGPFIGYPNDGTLIPAVTTGSLRNLVIPDMFSVYIVSQTDVLYCDFPPAELGSARARIQWQLPCGAPIFDLPPGYTANSAQLGIVNNIFHGPRCGISDLNCDGAVDANDFLILAGCLAGPGVLLEPSCAAADLDPDNDVDLADFAMLQTADGCS